MGTKSSDGHASPGSPNTAASLETDGDILQHIRAHVPPPNTVHGEEPLEGNDGSGGNTTRHLIFWHHPGERRQSRGAREGHSSKCRQQHPTARANLYLRGANNNMGGEQSERTQGRDRSWNLSLHSGALKRVTTSLTPPSSR
jgi:hypothetical protein